MTRETKIGLLVGLAFIIVIGILLSDHLTTSTEPPQATLAAAGNNVRSGVTTPGAGSGSVSATVVTPAAVSPAQTVPTAADLQPRPQPVQPAPQSQVQVAVGGPSAALKHPPAPGTTNDTSTTQAPITDTRSTEIANDVTTSEPVISKAPPVQGSPVEPTRPPVVATSNDIAAALRDTARAHGEEIVSLGGSNGTGNTNASGGSNRPGVPAGMKSYIAVDGDSLSKIAAKTMGANTKANRDAIINANASLKQNANLIVAGHAYNIPGTVPSGPSGTAVTSVATSSPPVIQAPPPAPVQPASTENWYTIKEGDTLTRIAQEQCGSTSAIPAILELNKESLKNPDRVVINTKIKLPNKPLASATN